MRHLSTMVSQGLRLVPDRRPLRPVSHQLSVFLQAVQFEWSREFHEKTGWMEVLMDGVSVHLIFCSFSSFSYFYSLSSFFFFLLLRSSSFFSLLLPSSSFFFLFPPPPLFFFLLLPPSSSSLLYVPLIFQNPIQTPLKHSPASVRCASRRSPTYWLPTTRSAPPRERSSPKTKTSFLTSTRIGRL